MSAAGLEDPDTTPNSAIDIDEDEVKEIVESIEEAEYFDASSMHPLTPASVVSLQGLFYSHCSDKAEGSCSSSEGI
jgi:hypothetical protein